MKEEFINIIINILKENNLETDNSDIFRGIETLYYDKYIKVYKLNKIENNIRNFNNNFFHLGGRVYSKKDNIANAVELKDTFFNYNDKFIYIIPSYLKDYDYINKFVKAKLKKLKDNKNMLVIASPIRANAIDYDKELDYLKEIKNNSKYFYSKVVIVNLNKIVIFDLNDSKYEVKHEN